MSPILRLLPLALTPGCLLVGWPGQHGTDTADGSSIGNRDDTDTSSTIIDTRDTGRDTGEDTSACVPSGPWDCLPAPTPIATYGQSAEAGEVVTFRFVGNTGYVLDMSQDGIFEVPLPNGPSTKVVSDDVKGGLGLSFDVGGGRAYYFTTWSALLAKTLPDGPTVELDPLSDVPPDAFGPHLHGGMLYYADENGWYRRDVTNDALPREDFGMVGTYPTFDAATDSVYFVKNNNIVAQAPVADPTAVTELTPALTNFLWGIQLEGTNIWYCNLFLGRVPGTAQLLGGEPGSCNAGYVALDGVIYAHTTEGIGKFSAVDGSLIAPLTAGTNLFPRHVSDGWLYLTDSSGVSGISLSRVQLP